MLLTSPLLSQLGVPHGFSTRIGGVSTAPFDSLNFGNPMDLPPSVARDPVSNIESNFRRVADSINAGGRKVVQVFQVHGADVHTFCEGAPLREKRSPRPGEALDTEYDFKADGLVTAQRDHLVAVRVADCTPILVASPDGRVVAAVHAGWRGVVLGVLQNALRAVAAHGRASGHAFDITRCVAAIGPCIGPTRFEVGPEVVAEFERAFGPASGSCPHTVPHDDPAARHRGKAYINMQAALRHQLRMLGVTQVDTIAMCTASDPGRFFSHRRDKGVTGRMIGIIGPR
ncbi:MAG TPA: polyphenol oxidase family protein [Phycisphaerales bacterium]|nr:polyphenol oxidase family protein [Phycisphaerales bacterium]